LAIMARPFSLRPQVQTSDQCALWLMGSAWSQLQDLPGCGLSPPRIMTWRI